jgi:hypothetical protein
LIPLIECAATPTAAVYIHTHIKLASLNVVALILCLFYFRRIEDGATSFQGEIATKLQYRRRH